MPYYLAPLVPDVRGYSPVGHDTQIVSAPSHRNWILLGNRALIWTHDPFGDARAQKVADDITEVGALSARSSIAAYLGDRSYPAGVTIQEMLVNLLQTPPAGKGWGPLRSRRDGIFEIFLGPGRGGENRIWTAPDPRGSRRASKTYTDSLTNRTSNLDGSTSSDGLFTWVEQQGTGWTVVTAVGATATGNVGFCVGRANAALDTDDHSVTANLTVFTRSAGILGTDILLRGTLFDAADQAYGFSQETNTGGNRQRIYLFDTDANVASNTASPATGVMYFEFNGSTYTAKIGGTTIFGPATDTAYAGGLKAGIGLYSDTAGNTGTMTTFEAADLAGGAAATAPAGRGMCLSGYRNMVIQRV